MPTPNNQRGQITRIFIVFLLLHSLLVIEAKYETPKCPIGFDVVVTRENSDLYCIRLKDSEHFNSKFIDCTDNQFTTKLYKNLNVTRTNKTVWAEYKTLYPGGPFIDWSYTDSTGDILTTSFEVKNIAETSINEDLCTVIEPSGKLAAVSCNEKHSRYCIVKPYEEFKDMTSDGCEGLQNYMRFWSPRATCLTYVKGRRGGNVRASWRQASDLCIQKNGTLLQRGWRFANHPRLHATKDPDEWMEPLGLVMTSGEKMLWVNTEDGSNEVSNSEWNFESGESFEDDTSLVAMKGDSWRLVNSSFIFYEVICERSIHLRNVSLNLTRDSEGLRLIVNDSSIDSSKIWCFTDSIIFFPSEVKVTRIDDSTDFALKPQTDGYFWCVHSDSKNFQVSESNKELYIKDKVTAFNLYAIKVQTREKFTLEHLDKLLSEWSQTLSEYVYLTTQYKRLYKKLPVTRGLNSSIDDLKELRLENKTYNVLMFMKFKRIYLDGKTALLQAQINSNLEPVPPGVWNNLTVIFMKPAYYCKSFDGVPSLGLGESTTINCITYSCVGDFNEGVNWVEVAKQGCIITTRPPSTVTSSLVFQTTTSSASPVEIVHAVSQARSANTRSGGAYYSDDTSEETPRPSPVTPSPSPSTSLPETTTVFIPETTTFTVTNYPTTTDSFTTERFTTERFTTDRFTTQPTTESFTTQPTIETTTPETLTTVTTIEVFETTTQSCRDETTTGVSTVTVFDSEGSVQTATSSASSSRPPPTPCERPPCGSTPATTARPSQELLENVMDNLEQLLQDESVPVNFEDVATSFDTIDLILGDETEEFEIPGHLLNILDRLGSRIVLNGTTTATSVRSNIALLLADAGPEAPCRGMKIFSRDDDSFNEGTFEFLTESPNATQLNSNLSEAVVHLPESVVQSERRISFVVFKNDRAFTSQPGSNVFTVNSRVLSVNVENVSAFQNGEVVDLHFRPISSDTNDTRICAYWHFMEDGTGVWSQEGCTFISSADPNMLDTCRCTHLTHFAELLISGTSFSDANEIALEVLSIVCSIISLFGLLMIGLTAALFRSWRRDFSNKIWLQLCIAIFVLLICFITVTFADFETSSTACMLIGVAMHYSVIASFCWMLVAALISYRRLVLVFTRDASHKLLRASAFAWGAPCAVVGILLSIDPQSYAGRYEESVTSGFCYPTGLGLWLAVYLPVSLMLFANWTLFALIVRSVFASRGIQRHGDSKEALRCATVSCLLVFLFGLPWIFGLFAWSITFSYLFTMTATLQGFVLFVFFVLGNKKTRDLWLNKLKIKQSRKVPVTSSTYKSSAGQGWRGASGKNVSIEANLSKPRSLALSDDSRFS